MSGQIELVIVPVINQGGVFDKPSVLKTKTNEWIITKLSRNSDPSVIAEVIKTALHLQECGLLFKCDEQNRIVWGSSSIRYKYFDCSCKTKRLYGSVTEGSENHRMVCVFSLDTKGVLKGGQKKEIEAIKANQWNWSELDQEVMRLVDQVSVFSNVQFKIIMVVTGLLLLSFTMIES